MPEGWPISFICLGLSLSIGLLVWVLLRDRRRRIEERRERALRVLRESRGEQDEQASEKVAEELARQLGARADASQAKTEGDPDSADPA
ncbi:MAG TPA: hypothetical protein VM492_07350 [Sumerlaeia bacterium]|nr:hypothetical protein [Sumerlaeia bacterium]